MSDAQPVVFRHKKLTRSEHASIQACVRGEASPDQQVAAMAVIIKSLAGVHDQSYIPGSVTDTAFKEGRRFVGNAILRYNTLPVSESKQEDEK